MKKKVLSNDPSENVLLSETDKQNRKALNLIVVGTKHKMLLSNPFFFSVEKEKLRKECLNFSLNVTGYLKDKFPFDKPFIRHAQYLHPEKRHDPAALNSISNLAMAICRSLGDKFPKVFHLPSGTTKEDVVDQVRTQWRMYKAESIPEDWFKVCPKPQSSKKSSPKKQYLSEAYKLCGLEVKETESCYHRINHYWCKYGAAVNENGNKKFLQLFAMVQCVLSVSHGNAFPERGFSINKFLLERHGNSCDENTIIALRTVKHELCRVGGKMNFPLTKGLRTSVHETQMKYFADLEERRRFQQEEEN